MNDPEKFSCLANHLFVVERKLYLPPEQDSKSYDKHREYLIAALSTEHEWIAENDYALKNTLRVCRKRITYPIEEARPEDKRATYEMRLLTKHLRVSLSMIELLNGPYDVTYNKYKKAKHPMLYNLDSREISKAQYIENAALLWMRSYKVREHMGSGAFDDIDLFLSFSLDESINHREIYCAYWMIVNNRICKAYDKAPSKYESPSTYPKYTHPFTPKELEQLQEIMGDPLGYRLFLPEVWYCAWHKYAPPYPLIPLCPGVCYHGKTLRYQKGYFNRALSDNWSVHALNNNGKQNKSRYRWLPHLIYTMTRGSIPSTHRLVRDMEHCACVEDDICYSPWCYKLKDKQLRSHKRKLDDSQQSHV
jgi:hypothetical protein